MAYKRNRKYSWEKKIYVQILTMTSLLHRATGIQDIHPQYYRTRLSEEKWYVILHKGTIPWQKIGIVKIKN